MRSPVHRLAAALLVAVVAMPAIAGPRGRFDQDRARAATRMGGMPYRDLQQQWRQGRPGYDYLGSDYDAESGNYRMKYMRDGAVDWIDVDGRTGRAIGRSGG